MAFLEYNPTRSLYQFCSVESFRKLIASKVIWCTDLDSANDPRELKLGYQHVVDALKFVRKNEYQGQAGDFLDFFTETLISGHARQQFFCACFSLLEDALPMWREYADYYRGVAIGFRPTAIASMPGRVQKVKYLNPDTPEEFRQLVRDLASDFDPERSPKDIAYWTSATSMLLTAVTALKHHSWEYEKEIRFVYAQMRADPGRSLPISGFSDGTLIHWEKPLSRRRGTEVVEYKAFEFGLRRRKVYEFSRAIARIIVGPRCELSVADVRTELQKAGFEEFDVVRSECEIR
jgi:hypothetical protein